ncbi:MAG TPA: hypothetical protein VLA50_01545, partial [Erythrobacter sp.]|nr:hypothetical protein [Erythrobacter sp.]
MSMWPGGALPDFPFLINAKMGGARFFGLLAIRLLPPLASHCTLGCYAMICGLASPIPTPNRQRMTGDDDSFHIRPGKVRDRGAG